MLPNLADESVAVPPEVRANYIGIIDSILAKSDLSRISEKKIRQGIQAKVEYDITPQKVSCDHMEQQPHASSTDFFSGCDQRTDIRTLRYFQRPTTTTTTAAAAAAGARRSPEGAQGRESCVSGTHNQWLPCATSKVTYAGQEQSCQTRSRY
jgi:DEK C terminal domain